MLAAVLIIYCTYSIAAFGLLARAAQRRDQRPVTTDLNTEPTIRHRDRTIEMVWEAGPGTDSYGEPCEDVITLTSMHSDRKMFFAHLRREQVLTGGIRSFIIHEYVSVLTEPVARFSQKALDAFAVGALAALRERLGEPDVQAITNPVKEAA